MKRKILWSFAGIVIVLVLFVFSTIGIARYKGTGTVQMERETVQILTDPQSIEEGKRLYITRGCADCHDTNLGGKVIIDDLLAGVIAGANLTSGKNGRAGEYKSDSDWVMAIRHGIDPAGRKLVFMPSYEFHHFADDEVGKLIAYIKSVPPVDNNPPKPTLGLMLSLAYLMGDIPVYSAEVIPHQAPHDKAVSALSGIDLGKYLSNGCIGCHGTGFSGGKIPGTPPDFPLAGNITPDSETGIGNWTEQQFVTLMRTGKRPNGEEVNPFMPWKFMGKMTDRELSALWAYLRTVPKKAYGNR